MELSEELEIAIMPGLPRGLSIEDQLLERTAPSFGPQYALPNEAFATMLRLINISKRDYVAAVGANYGIDLTSSLPHGPESGGVWAWTGEYAPMWRRMNVRANRARPPLLSFEELFEIMENANYGGQFSVAAYIDVETHRRTDWSKPVYLEGVVQIGIVDYIWGSGHTITHRCGVAVNAKGGTVGFARDIGFYTYDGCCDFIRESFRIRKVSPCRMPRGVTLRRMNGQAPEELA